MNAATPAPYRPTPFRYQYVYVPSHSDRPSTPVKLEDVGCSVLVAIFLLFLFCLFTHLDK